MGIVILTKPATGKELAIAKKDYQTYLKITVDLERKIIAIGGEYHLDGEQLLIASGSKRENIFGGGLDLETKAIDCNALINIRPGVNESPEILDPKIRKKFILLAKKFLAKYV